MINPLWLDELIDTLLKIKTKGAMLDFLRGILTPRELEQLPTRLQIIKKLKRGTNQQNIAKSLGVGVATVTRGSRELKQGRFQNIS